jgi:hypothetical protein
MAVDARLCKPDLPAERSAPGASGCAGFGLAVPQTSD